MLNVFLQFLPILRAILSSMNIQQIMTRSQLCLVGLLSLTLFATPVAAQVFDPGPSNSALFDRVINVPGDFFGGSFVGGTGLILSSIFQTMASSAIDSSRSISA